MKLSKNWGRLVMKFNIWNDCPKQPITELLSFIVDNRGKTVPTTEKGYKLIATNCIRNEKLYPSYEKVRYLSEETYNNWFRSHPKPGDIIFVNKGTPGRVCMVPDPVDFCIAQDMIALRADNEKIYNKYLFAVLRSPIIQKQIYNTNVGDVIPHFKKQFMNQLLIPIPERRIQKFIGDMYFDISYKIELNQKINENLEQQAQAIFKSWFVDFEPFKDSEFVNSELGQIPKGWKVDNLLNIADYTNGLAMQKFRPNENEAGIPVLKIKELRQGFCDSSSDICSENIKSDFIINDGDIIFSWSGSLMIDFWCGGKCGLNQHLFKVTSNEYDKWFYYMWTEYHLEKFIAIAKDKATTMGHIKREELKKSLVLIPDEKSYNKISQLMKPIYDILVKKRLENKTLAKLRDTLLPKLMNGEIDVSDIKI